MDTGTLHEREPPACLDLGEAHHKVNVFNAYEFNIVTSEFRSGSKCEELKVRKASLQYPNDQTLFGRREKFRRRATSGHPASLPEMTGIDPKLPWSDLLGLVDHLVGAQQNRSRHRKAERLGGLEVDRHLKFDRLLNGQVGRLRATENAIDIKGGATEYISQFSSVGKQTACSRNNTSPIDGWHVVSGCQQYN